MRVFLTGGTGVLGRALVPRLRAAGHDVAVLTSSVASGGVARSLGATAVPGDLLEPDSLDAISADIVVHLATSIPRPDTGTGSWEVNDRIRRDGTRHLVAAAAAGIVGRIVGYSAIWVYGDHGDEWITESTPLPEVVRPEIRSAIDLEDAVMTSGLDWVVVRGGHLYGPGTGATEQLLTDAAAGRLVIDGAGDAFDSLVHPEDTAQGLELALDRIPPGTVVNVVDDVPLRQRDVLRLVAERAGGPAPSFGPDRPGWGSLRVSNARARSLGFRPQYPDVRAGLAAMTCRALEHPGT